MRLMFDSVNWKALPEKSWVAGYINGPVSQWPAEAWAKFTTHKPIRISVLASVNDGDVLDVETGDATPAQAPGWVKARLASGHLTAGPSSPTLYCNRSNMTAVVDACVAAGLRWGIDFHLWVATLDGTRQLPGDPAIAIQFRGAVAGEPWDVSLVLSDAWHPFPPAPPKPAPVPAWQGQALQLASDVADTAATLTHQSAALESLIKAHQ